MYEHIIEALVLAVGGIPSKKEGAARFVENQSTLAMKAAEIGHAIGTASRLAASKQPSGK
jgi:hypothetical protein